MTGDCADASQSKKPAKGATWGSSSRKRGREAFRRERRPRTISGTHQIVAALSPPPPSAHSQPNVESHLIRGALGQGRVVKGVEEAVRAEPAGDDSLGRAEWLHAQGSALATRPPPKSRSPIPSPHLDREATDALALAVGEVRREDGVRVGDVCRHGPSRKVHSHEG